MPGIDEMNIVIKVLGPADLDLLCSADTEVFDNPVDPQLAAAYLARDDYVIALAVDGGKVVGMASGLIYFHPDKQPEFFVNEVGVADSHTRRGIAKNLMRSILDWARGKGCSYCWLGTEDDNDAANALYKSIGGKLNIMHYYEFILGDKDPA